MGYYTLIVVIMALALGIARAGFVQGGVGVGWGIRGFVLPGTSTTVVGTVPLRHTLPSLGEQKMNSGLPLRKTNITLRVCY